MNDEAPVFNFTPGEIKAAGDRAVRDFEAAAGAITGIPAEERTFDNTVYAFERAMNEFGDTVHIPAVMAYVSADAEVRKAAQELELRIGRYSVDIFTREDIFGALNGFAASAEKPAGVEGRLLEKTLLDFRKNGLGLPSRAKNRVKKLLKELVELELRFSKNLREAQDALAVSKEELAGLPDDFAARLKRTPEGGYLVTTNYPDYMPFMDNAESDAAREKLEAVFNRRCVPENVKLLEDAITLRRKIAKLIGYASFADYMLDDRMAGNSANVLAFLERTAARLRKKARRELRERVKLRNARTGGAERTLKAWETRYYNNMLKKTRYSLDHDKIRRYFPLETVLGGMLDIFGRVFGARFVPSDIPVWHKDVRAYEVLDAGGSVTAFFYLDLFPREGKYKHAACFGVRRGRALPGGGYARPAAAIVANFPPPSAGTPSLLKFDDLVTLFHEFGHVTHNIFTRARYGKFSGTSVSRDFVEVPSKMLENWAYDGEVLKRVSGNYLDPEEKLPDDVITRLIESRNMDSGLAYLRQIFFSVLDLKYHTAKGRTDTTGTYQRLMKKIALVPMSPGTHPQAGFNHLMAGYEAGYYSYLWSEVIAADLFSVFKREGMMNAEAGARYRELILAPGRSFDEAGQVEKFLGRPAGESAFLESLGAV